MSSITLLTSAGAVRVAGEGLVIDLRFIAEPAGAAVTAGNDLREPVAAEQGQIIREGDAPRETGRFGGVASCPDTEFPETPANPSAPQARQAVAGEVTSSASPATHSSNDAIGEVKGSARLPNATGVEPSLPEADAGGPVSASAPNSDPAERPSDAIFGERFSHPTSNVTTISSQPAGSVGVPHSKPHKSGKLEDQPSNLSDPRDPGPIPTWMDKRAKKDAA